MTTLPTLLHLVHRPRRNRLSPAIRALTRETQLSVHDLIQPLFVKEGTKSSEPIGSMPGISRFNLHDLIREAGELQELGVKAVALFPQIEPSYKDAQGSYALDEKSWYWKTLREIKKAHPDLLLIADVALDPFTDHGHDGVLNSQTGLVANDPTVNLLTQFALLLAEAGVDFVAPSDMMDGRIGAIRRALDLGGFADVGIISYAAKFCSAYYGPFRDAVGSKQSASYLDKSSYQLCPANARESLREARLDEEEGADILMVKPAGLYLDIIHALRAETKLPLAAYQVSGEYAQIHAAAERGWLNLEKARHESLLAIKRAGADMILTYFAKEMAKELKNGFSCR